MTYVLCRTIVFLLDVAVQYGMIEEMNVCDNLGDHLVGNVYVKVQILVTSGQKL